MKPRFPLAGLLMAPALLFAQLDTTRVIDSLMTKYVQSWEPSGLAILKPGMLKPAQAFSIYQSYFPNDQDNDLIKVRTDSDAVLGLTHHRYRQYYKGIPVEGTFLIEHVDLNNYLIAANGKLSYMDKDTTGAMNKMEATDSLANTYDGWGAGYKWAWLDPEWEQDLKDESGNQDTSYFPYANGTLVWALWNYDKLDFFIPDSCLRLAWRFEVYCLDPMFHEAYYVDAHTGEVFLTHDLFHANGPATIPIYGNVTLDTRSRGWPHNDFTLHAQDQNRNVHTKYYYQPNGTPGAFSLTPEITDDDDNWGIDDTAATAVHYYGMMSWDFFADTYGWEGSNGNGKKLKIKANAGNIEGFAFFDLNPERIVIGNLFTSSDSTYLGVADVVGHEYTHGIIKHTAELMYLNESGALNESVCDIFGLMVEAHIEGAVNNWTVIEDANTGRSLEDPGSSGFHISCETCTCGGFIELGQPEIYEDDFWYFGECDNGGVHINSGVQNHWFYLLAHGGVFNGVTIAGIGEDDAATILWFAVRFMLGESSEYDDARTATTYMAEWLFGACSQQHISTIRAWNAVEVPGTTAPCALSAPETGLVSDPTLRVYPNPSGGRFILQSNVSFEGQVRVMTIDGRMVHAERLDNAMQHQLNLDISPGIYLLVVNNQGITETKRITVQ